MNCPRCQSANRPTARFCQNCGAPLAIQCPQCGANAEPGAKFCDNCGAALAAPKTQTQTQPSVEPIQARLQKYMSREFAAKLEESRASVGEGERRIATVLFCDVKGSTAMAEKLDPEDWAEVMNGAFEYLIAPVFRYEGTVVRLLGDAILAFFGAPVAHEDDPQRAVLAGLEIVEGIRRYREQLSRQRGLDFNVRVGINTGLVVVGEIGSDLRAEYTVMGDAVNLAARMEQTAQPGTLQISGGTYKLIAPLFDFESLGGVEVKGKGEPVPVYRVLGVKAKAGRLRGIEGLDAPLIGRDQEIATLRSAITHLRRGRGQIINLIGEAGLGKSRLISEMKTAWESSRPDEAHDHWSESRGISFDTLYPYGQTQQHLRNIFGLTEEDAPEVVRERISGILDEMAVPIQNRAGQTQAFEALLAVGTEAKEGVLEGEALKHEVFEVVNNLLRAMAQHGPTVLVFDDLHWADPASVELLQYLFQLMETLPVLFVCGFRPDRQAGSWQVKQTAETLFASRYIEIVLQPLTPQDSNTLVDSLLTISDLPSKLRELILKKSEGNPFFVEEVVRSLIDSGAVIRDASGARWQATKDVDKFPIPDNLQALLMARIDRLQEDSRRTLQLAAVIGRSFYYRVLEMISNTTSELDRQIGVLQAADLIREAAHVPELEYMFRHALTRDAAYNSILLKRRREFHLRVGITLETLFADRLEEQAPLLGYHFYEAGDQRAIKYYTMAGDMAYRLYANTEAISHYSRAIDIARLGESSADQLTYLYTRKGRALELIASYEQAIATYKELEVLAQDRGDQSMGLSAALALGTAYSIIGGHFDPVLAHNALARARDLSEASGDKPTHARILWNLMMLNIYNSGDLHQAVAFGEESLAITRELNLREQMAYTITDITFAFWGIGQMVRAQELLNEGVALWRELGNLPMLTDALSRYAQCFFYEGNYRECLKYSDESFQVAQTINHAWGQVTSRFMGSYICYWDRGQSDRAIEILEGCSALAKQFAHNPAIISMNSDLGLIYASLGNLERGLSHIQVAADLSADGYFVILQPWAQVRLARVYMMCGDLPAAEQALKQSRVHLVEESLTVILPTLVAQAEAELAFAKQDYAQVCELLNQLTARLEAIPLRPYLPEAYYRWGEALRFLGKFAEARDMLLRARAAAERLESRRMLWQILSSLEQVETACGAAESAATFRRLAQEYIGYIADHTGSPELRVSFLNLPEVQRVLQTG